MIKTTRIMSLEAFRESHRDWDELWKKTGSHVANHRAAVIDLQTRSFINPTEFRAVLVHDDHETIAAIPFRLIERNILGATAVSLGGPNTMASTLLLHPDFHLNVVGPEIIRALDSMNVAVLKLDWMNLSERAVQQIPELANELALTHYGKERFKVGVVSVPEPGELSHHTSSNHRKKLRRWERELSGLGPVQLLEFDSSDISKTQLALEQAFQVEQRSWKGTTHSAILSNAKDSKYWRDWSETLMNTGEFRIYLLFVGDNPVAFDFGYLVNRVYSSVKISHVDELSHIGVGHVRDLKLIERFSAEKTVDRIDTFGPLTELKWQHETYGVGRHSLSTGGWLGSVRFGLNEAFSGLSSCVFGNS